MELDYKAIGKRIKIARIKADLTQERLAELIDISPTHLSNIETGTTRVSLNTIISIANALSVTGDDLLCDNIIMSKVQFEKDMADFSAGQKKKVLLARSLCEPSHLLVWDEPLNYVDVLSRMQIEDLLLEFQPTIVFVEHDRVFCDHVATKAVML